jgi:putative SOS response-associated peptidase YedK
VCGRYKLSAKSGSLYEFFDIHGEIPFEFVPRYNIAPTQPITVVREPHKLELLGWGAGRVRRLLSGVTLRGQDKWMRSAEKR